jgi:hypothetical protein
MISSLTDGGGPAAPSSLKKGGKVQKKLKVLAILEKISGKNLVNQVLAILEKRSENKLQDFKFVYQVLAIKQD